jgi:hypothetical protein
MAEVRKLGALKRSQGGAAGLELAMRQTVLTEVDHIDFHHPVKTVQLVKTAGNGLRQQSALLVRMRNGSESALALPNPYSSGSTTPVAPLGLREPTQNGDRTAQVFWRGKERHFAVMSHTSERTDILAEYTVPSTYEVDTGRDELFAQISTDGHRVTLYQRRMPVVFGTTPKDSNG